MSFLRACLFSTTALIAGAVLTQSGAQPSPRNGEAVMAQPDAITIGRVSKLRFLTAPEHDLFTRAFDTGTRGDWAAARSLAAQGQNATAKRLLEWRYALDRNSGATFAEIDAVIRATGGKGAAAWPLQGTLQARAMSSPGSRTRHPIPASAKSGWARRWWRPATPRAARP